MLIEQKKVEKGGTVQNECGQLFEKKNDSQRTSPVSALEGRIPGCESLLLLF
jgi:hypothetical protein